MAAKGKEEPKEAQTVGTPESHTIERLRVSEGVPESVHAGACLRMGWRRGKEVTRQEYLQAVEKFKGSGAGRRRHA